MSSMHPLLEAVREGVVIGDGAIGTALFSRGAPLRTGVERLNLTEPGMVETLHRDYITAGSRVIETNTFGANAPMLARYGAENDVRRIILAGVEIARSASAGKAWVAGSAGPLPLVDGESLSASEQTAAFEEVIGALIDGGVDLIMFETFIDASQLALAVKTARGMTGMPIVAQMAFEPEGRLAGGERIERFAEPCIEAGADIIGANCGAGVPAVRNAVKNLVRFGAPVSAFMNAGFAERIEERIMFVAPDEYLASTAAELACMGARLIGGCCGTTPETIEAIAASLATPPCSVTIASAPAVTLQREPHPSVTDRRASAPSEPETPPAPEPPHGILVELDPPKSMDVTTVVEAARILKVAGAGAVTLADNPLASVRVDVLAVAGIVRRETGIDIIPHLTGRDRNRIALQSFIMGAHVLGIRSLLCVTGDPVRMYNETNTSGVFDVTSIGLVKLATEFNEGRRTGDGAATSFSVGVALNPNVRNIQSQTGKLVRKIEAGAAYALTQPIFAEERLDALESSLEANGIDIPVFTGVMPLMSSRNAEFLHNEVPGISIPDEFRALLARYDNIADQRRAGIDIAVGLAEKAVARGFGLYLVTPRNKTEFVLPVIEAVKPLMKRKRRSG